MSDHDDTAELPIVQAEPGPKAAPRLTVEIDLGALSDPGRTRKNNEDHFMAARFDRSMRTLSSNLPPGYVPAEFLESCYAFLVADGVGGAVAGELASRTAVQALVDLVLESPTWIMRFDDGYGDQVLQRTEQRFQKAREVLVARAAEDPRLKGMATTMTFACSIGHDLLTAHVGDSRAYLFRRDGRLERLTHDQTMAQSLADAGAITQEDVEHHPSRHVLTSALATRGAFVQVQLKHSRIEDGDVLLLCSDGLTEMVPDATITRVLGLRERSAETCRRLVELALEAGGKDNVTVIAARYQIR
ncbi:MAG TPA: protein phosphatase 2C domain-containing protein [Thermoanaerobaculia bacterium]|nr:protein phosphatase 2C domain-containing protein [Thermoanaerobaculia bacterium]